jgi:hypothetical protein
VFAALECSALLHCDSGCAKGTVASNEVRTSAVSTGVGPLSVAVSKRVSPLCKPVSAPKSWHECCAVTEIPADETLKIFFSAS